MEKQAFAGTRMASPSEGWMTLTGFYESCFEKYYTALPLYTRSAGRHGCGVLLKWNEHDVCQ